MFNHFAGKHLPRFLVLLTALAISFTGITFGGASNSEAVTKSCLVQVQQYASIDATLGNVSGPNVSQLTNVCGQGAFTFCGSEIQTLVQDYAYDMSSRIVQDLTSFADCMDGKGRPDGASGNQCGPLKKFNANNAKVKILGSPKVTYELSALAAGWSPAPAGFGYQWFRNGKSISGAGAESYVLTSLDLGKSISVAVTAYKTCFTDSPKTSGLTAKILKGSLSKDLAKVTLTSTMQVGGAIQPGAYSCPATVRTGRSCSFHVDSEQYFVNGVLVKQSEPNSGTSLWAADWITSAFPMSIVIREKLSKPGFSPSWISSTPRVFIPPMVIAANENNCLAAKGIETDPDSSYVYSSHNFEVDWTDEASGSSVGTNLINCEVLKDHTYSLKYRVNDAHFVSGWVKSTSKFNALYDPRPMLFASHDSNGCLVPTGGPGVQDKGHVDGNNFIYHGHTYYVTWSNGSGTMLSDAPRYCHYNPALYYQMRYMLVDIGGGWFTVQIPPSL